MICEHPECTGKHSGTPRSAWCPAARERHNESIRNRRADPVQNEKYKARQREHFREKWASSPQFRERKRDEARQRYRDDDQFRENELARKRESYIPHPRELDRPCCRDAGGRCPQHKQWSEFRTFSRAQKVPHLAPLGICDFVNGKAVGISVRHNPDDYWPDDAEDRAQERAIAEWLAIA